VLGGGAYPGLGAGLRGGPIVLGRWSLGRGRDESWVQDARPCFTWGAGFEADPGSGLWHGVGLVRSGPSPSWGPGLRDQVRAGLGGVPGKDHWSP
jgi:hypothetical protein